MPASVPTCLVPASKLTCAPPVANVQNCRGSPTQQLRRSACFGNTSKLSRVRQICHRHVHQNRHAAGLVRSAADNVSSMALHPALSHLTLEGDLLKVPFCHADRAAVLQMCSKGEMLASCSILKLGCQPGTLAQSAVRPTMCKCSELPHSVTSLVACLLSTGPVAHAGPGGEPVPSVVWSLG